LLPPKDFKELFAPRLKKIVDAGHKHGMKVIMHSCGNLNLLWEDLVSTGIDALHPLEPTARMNLVELKRKTPNLTFIGNVSPQDLQDKDPEFIRDYTKKLMTEAKVDGRFMLSSGHSINPAVNLENYLAMRETHEKYAKY
ncbi:MAG: uroporphyrinogen decarboxylase family protein, partial [Promethearchaeota archaeon]